MVHGKAVDSQLAGHLIDTDGLNLLIQAQAEARALAGDYRAHWCGIP
jgi:hypothetical protein